MQRNRRGLLGPLLAVLAGALSLPSPVTVRAVAPPPVSIAIEGHGWGHGVGLSQYGALGYAVNFGWSAAQILDHYYGGTVASTVAPSEITVRLSALDGFATAVVHDKAALIIDSYVPALGQPATWRSLVTNEISEGHYRVWGRSDANVCPATGVNLDDPANGWTVVIADQAASVTIRPQTDTSASADVSDLVGLCEPSSGRVRYYRGAIRAINNNALANRTVSVVPLEQYLRSVVAGEVSAGWAAMGQGKGAQALQAQAVAARSYGLAENKEAYAKTCDSGSCQMYRGAAYRAGVGGLLVAQEFAATDAAVAATTGLVRRYGSEAGAIAYTMFSSSSGGYTAKTSLGFAPVVDDGDAVSSNAAHSWTVSVGVAAIESAWPAIGSYSGIVVKTREGFGEWGGRVLSMRIVGSAGAVNISGDSFRATMGLKSNWFHLVGDTSVSAPTDPCGSQTTSTVSGVTANGTASRFTPLTPSRLIDTRSGLGVPAAPLAGGCTLTIDPNVGTDATAVVVNVTSVTPAVNGFLTAYPCGAERPFVSIVPSVAGRIVPGTAIVPLNADGTFCVYSSTTTDLVIDLSGVYGTATGQRFQPIAPQRFFDSLASPLVRADSVVRVQIAGTRGVPASATGAAVTVQSSSAVGAGFVTIWPCDAERPTTSVLNATAGVSVTNHVQLGFDNAGGVCMYAATAMRLMLDVSGWFGPAASADFHALMPQRLLDTRENIGLAGRFAAGQNRAIGVTGVGGVPAVGVMAIAAEVTSVGALKAAYITVHPCLAKVPNVSMVRNVANSVAATTVTGVVDGAGRWCLRSNVSMHVLIDVSGWYGT